MKWWAAAVLGGALVLGACSGDDTPASPHAAAADVFADQKVAAGYSTNHDALAHFAVLVCDDAMPALVEMKGDWEQIGLAHDAIAAVCPDQMGIYKALYPA